MTGSTRAHTGRRRNEAARQAILSSVTAQLAESRYSGVTIDQIATRAGVSKQTIYRWWPTKTALLADVMGRWAQTHAPQPDTGDVYSDIAAFLTTTFSTAAEPAVAQLLRTLLSEAQIDRRAAETLEIFARDRRTTLRELLKRGQTNGQLTSDIDLDVLVDQAYGLLWYRLSVCRAPLDETVAIRLTDNLCRPSLNTAQPRG